MITNYKSQKNKHFSITITVVMNKTYELPKCQHSTFWKSPSNEKPYKYIQYQLLKLTALISNSQIFCTH